MDLKKSFGRSFPGYLSVIGFVLLTAGLFYAHQENALNYAFPLLGGLWALFLYLSYRNVYVAFVWWIWLFTPLVRRLVDYHTIYHSASPVMVTPLLVTSVSVIPLLIRPRFILKRSLMPFLAIFIVYLYALLVGIIENGVFAALFDFANSLAPLTFGLFLVKDHLNFARNRESILYAINLGLLLIAAYGLYQFYYAPPWDSFWITASHFSSAGNGEAEQIRLFGTLNSPAPYGLVLMASLVYAMVTKGSLKIAAAGIGFPAFGLSLFRSGWAGWVLAMLFLIARMKTKTRLRFTLAIIFTALIVVPLVTVGPVAATLEKRFSSFGNVQQDRSFQARRQLYETFAIQAISQPLGAGFGALGGSTKVGSAATTNIGIDSGVLQVPYEFGWAMGLIFVWSIGSIFLTALRSALATKDQICIAGAAIFIAMCAENLGGYTFSGAPGLITWVGVAFALMPIKIEAGQIRTTV